MDRFCWLALWKRQCSSILDNTKSFTGTSARSRRGQIHTEATSGIGVLKNMCSRPLVDASFSEHFRKRQLPDFPPFLLGGCLFLEKATLHASIKAKVTTGNSYRYVYVLTKNLFDQVDLNTPQSSNCRLLKYQSQYVAIENITSTSIHSIRRTRYNRCNNDRFISPITLELKLRVTAQMQDHSVKLYFIGKLPVHSDQSFPGSNELRCFQLLIGAKISRAMAVYRDSRRS